MELIKKINALNIQLNVVNNSLQIKAPKGVLTPELLALIKEEKESLIRLITNAEENLIPLAEKRANYPLSSLQKRLWVLSQFEDGNKAYIIPSVFKINGNLNFDILTASFKYLINRHESLRIQFLEIEGEVYQHVVDKNKIAFEIEKKLVSNERAKDLIALFYDMHFDLSIAPLLKAQVLEINKSEFYLLFAIHHVIGDGWSMEVFTNELMYVYQKISENNAISLPDLRIQYTDYVTWIENEEFQKRLENQSQYWKKMFAGELPVLDLPSFKKRPLIKTHSGATKFYDFSNEFYLKINKFIKERELTLYVSLLAGINGLFYRYTNSTDIILGTPIAGRNHSELEAQIGLYLNTLAIRTTFESSDSFNDLLEKQKKVVLEVFENQDYPFEKLIQDLGIKRDPSRSLLFDVLIVLQNQNKASLEMNAFSVVKYQEINRSVSQFDMTFSFSEETDSLRLRLEYNTDIYEAFQIDLICNHLEHFMIAALNTPEQSINTLSFLKEEEIKELTFDFNNTLVDYPKEKTILNLFREQVIKSPSSKAIVFKNFEITYKELDNLSNELANFILHNKKIEKNEIIGIQLERSEWIVIGMLAILKVGAAYVSIDPNYPLKRIEYIKQDSKCDIIIDEEYLKRFRLFPNKTNVLPQVNLNPSDLAYIIYTSGSTGHPKGVMIEHISLVNFLFDYQLGIHNTSLTCKTIFDVSVFEIIGTITSGSTLYIPEEEIVYQPVEYAKFLYENKISHCYLHPMHLELISNELATYDEIFLQKILIGVEGIKPKSIQWFYDNNIEIINAYGPTECTICATKFKVENLNDIHTPNLPIGIPLQNYEVYILNELGNQLVPKGVIGELFISGLGLSRGYLNRLELTKEKFVDHPFKFGKKIYRTGDLGRYLKDGNIEFIGRKDSQIKLRGNRIELGEIEYAMINLGFISQAVVTIVDYKSEKELAAYFVSNVELCIDEIRNSLRDYLPTYMIPNLYMQINEIPITPNGKVDKKSLPNFILTKNEGRIYKAPTNKIEKQLVEIWKEILKIDDTGIFENFFDLGGNSLHLIQLNTKIKEIFNVHLRLTDLIKDLNIYSLAVKIKVEEKKQIVIPKILSDKKIPLTPLQEKIWYTCQTKSRKNSYNMVITLPNISSFDYNDFYKKIENLILNYRILRVYFKLEEGKLTQNIETSLSVENILEQIVLPDKDVNFSEKIIAFQNKEKNYEFDLEKPGLFRISVVTSGEINAIIFNIHHIICDKISLEILKKELLEESLVETKNEGNDFLDYANWLYEYTKSKELLEIKKKIDFQFEDIKEVKLPIEVKNAREDFSSTTIDIDMSIIENEKLSNLNRELNITPFSFWSFAWGTTLSLLAEEESILISSPVNSRFHQNLFNEPGLFLNTLQIPIKVNKNNKIANSLQESFYEIVEGIDNNYPIEYFIPSEKRKALDQYFIIYNEVNNDSDKIKQEGNELGKFSLALIITKSRGGYKGAIQFDSRKYSKTEIDLLGIRFLNICNQILSGKFFDMSELNIKLETEQELINIKSEFIF